MILKQAWSQAATLLPLLFIIFVVNQKMQFRLNLAFISPSIQSARKMDDFLKTDVNVANNNDTAIVGSELPFHELYNGNIQINNQPQINQQPLREQDLLPQEPQNENN